MKGSCWMSVARRFALVIIAGFFLTAGVRHALGNLVNFYSWTSLSANPSFPNEVNPVSVVNANSAGFYYPSFAHNNSSAFGFAGGLATTPGAYYEISFTLQNLSPSAAVAGMSFGNFTASLTPAINVFYLGSLGPQHNPVSFDFIILALSPTTRMDFFMNLDNPGGGAYLSNVSVKAVPEQTSTAVLLAAALAGLLVCGRRWRFPA